MKEQFAVFEKQTDETRGWFTNEKNETVKVSFYTKLDTGLLEFCITAPRHYYMSELTNVYDFNSKLAKEFGVVKSSGNLGSYSEIFLYKKLDKLVELFVKHGFTIVHR